MVIFVANNSIICQKLIITTHKSTAIYFEEFLNINFEMTLLKNEKYFFYFYYLFSEMRIHNIIKKQKLRKTNLENI